MLPYGSNPYLNFEFNRGKHKIRVRLDDNEIENLIKVPPSITRDCAVFQLFTGISHRDLYQLSKDNIRRNGKDVWLEGLRKKSNELYTIFLLPEVVKIIDRYAGEERLIPAKELYQYNRDLKVLAATAGITKALTTYVLRHTAATMMLRRGVPISTISSILGHTSIETTQIYAKLEATTMKEQMLKAFSVPPEKIPRKKKPNQPKRT